MKWLTQKAHFFALLFILTSCLLVYLKSLSNEPIPLLDDSQFLSNPGLLHFDLYQIFTTPTVAQYYPLTIMSMAADWHICGPNVPCLHIGSLFYHLLNCVLVYFLALRLFRLPTLWAFLATLLFALHPMNVEPVAWLSARNQIFSAVFQLLAIFAYLEFLNNQSHEQVSLQKQKWYFGVLALYVLALFAKVISIVLPFVFLLLDLMKGRRDFKAMCKEKIPFVILAAPFVAYAMKLSSVNGFMMSSNLGWADRISWAAKGVVFYWGRMVFPLSLTVHYDIFSYHLTVVEWSGFLLLLVILVGGAFLKKQAQSRVALSLAVFLLYFLPISKLYSFGSDSVFGDRYMYLPIAFIACGLCALLCEWNLRRSFRFAVVALMIGSISLSALLSYKQSLLWQNTEKLFGYLVKKYPKDAYGYNVLGVTLLRQQRFDEAQVVLNKALSANSNYYLAYPNLAYIYFHQGLYQQSVDSYAKAISLQPGIGAFYSMAGHVYLEKLNNPEKAANYFEQSIAHGTDDQSTELQLAEAEEKLGHLAAALVHRQKASQLANY